MREIYHFCITDTKAKKLEIQLWISGFIIAEFENIEYSIYECKRTFLIHFMLVENVITGKHFNTILDVKIFKDIRYSFGATIFKTQDEAFDLMLGLLKEKIEMRNKAYEQFCKRLENSPAGGYPWQ